jgi:hypothetical protein
VLTLAVSAHTKKGPKICVDKWAFKKSFSRTANENRGAGRQSRTTKSIEKNFVFKDSFEKKRAAQRMRIWSVKSAPHFDKFDEKASSESFD